MHEYRKTGRAATDRCIELANKAHNYYFSDPIKYKFEFAKTAKEFFEAIEGKFLERQKKEKINDALKDFFKDNFAKYKYFSTELYAIRLRLNIIIRNPSLVDTSTKFVLDHTARFMEVILPYACSVEKEVEKNKKFSDILTEEVSKKFVFFKHMVPDKVNHGKYVLFSNTVTNKYLQAFYDDGWRVQKDLNGLKFMEKHFDKNDPTIMEFLRDYGGYDFLSSLMFARMANEQFMKYLSSKYEKVFWVNLESSLGIMSEETKKNLFANRDNDDKSISIPSRINALEKAGVLNELISNEAKLVNSRGNGIAHNGVSVPYSSCYHNLEFLNYLEKYCK